MTREAPFPPKTPDEEIYHSMDFAELLAAGETIQSASCTASQLSGPVVDPNPQAMISGTAAIFGTKVQQKIVGGLLGNKYVIVFEVTTSLGQTFHESAEIEIEGD